MGLEDKLSKIGDRVRDGVGHGMDKLFGDEPDSAAAPAANPSPDKPITMADADVASAGFPEELR